MKNASAVVGVALFLLVTGCGSGGSSSQPSTSVATFSSPVAAPTSPTAGTPAPLTTSATAPSSDTASMAVPAPSSAPASVARTSPPSTSFVGSSLSSTPWTFTVSKADNSALTVNGSLRNTSRQKLYANLFYLTVNGGLTLSAYGGICVPAGGTIAAVFRDSGGEVGVSGPIRSIDKMTTSGSDVIC